MTSLAFAEVFELYQILGDEYIKKIPSNVWEHIKKNKANNYNVDEVRHKLWNREITNDALNFYSAINYRYIVEDELEKKILIEIYDYNSRVRNNNLSSSNTNSSHIILNENLFDGVGEEAIKEEKAELTIPKKENIFDKFIKFIKKLFK